MDLELERRFNKLSFQLEEKFGMDMDIKAIVFLIGVQELGLGWKKYSKNEKMELMHVGTCTILKEFGYYEFIGRDDDGWPHFELNEQLPSLELKDQEALLKKGVVEYFNNFFGDVFEA